MRSDLIKEGPSRAPHRSLLRALGIDELEMKRPFVAVVNSKVIIFRVICTLIK